MNLLEAIPELAQSIYRFNKQLIDLDKIVSISDSFIVWDYKSNDDDKYYISLIFHINSQGNEKQLNESQQREKVLVNINDFTKDEMKYFTNEDYDESKCPHFDEIRKNYIELIKVWSKYKKLKT